jgi:hypothetical protein
MAGGAEDYLHEAALAEAPPSGTFYDPNHPGDGTRLESLGVHEHWNNPVDKQYSRNLGTGEGIELVLLHSDVITGDIDSDGDVDEGDLVLLCDNWLQAAGPDRPDTDLNADGFTDSHDLTVLAANWGTVTAQNAGSDRQSVRP